MQRVENRPAIPERDREIRCLLREHLRTGELDEPLREEILDIEIAANELRFLPRCSASPDVDAASGPRVKVHPLLRIIHFRHDSRALLARLAALDPLPYDLEVGEYTILLIAGNDGIETRLIHTELAQLLETLDSDRGSLLDVTDAALLVHEPLPLPHRS